MGTVATHTIAELLAGPLQQLTDDVARALELSPGALAQLRAAGALYSPITGSVWLPDAPPSATRHVGRRAPKQRWRAHRGAFSRRAG